MKIILIGFMGSGKSSVADDLSIKLDLKKIEMDNLVLKKSKRKDIQEIFSLDGEKYFRDLETIAAKEVSKLDNVIVSTGGGVVMKEKNREFLKKGTIIFLKTSFEILEKRLRGNGTRPLFKDKIKAKKLFDLRQNMYEKWADHTILTDKKPINEVVNCLVNLL